MFCEAVDNVKEVRVVFCDISKAFDRVWHKGLLHKLHGIGCSGEFLSWFSSYISVRRQLVVLDGKLSNWVEVLAWVPQGSILGPLLLSISMTLSKVLVAPFDCFQTTLAYTLSLTFLSKQQWS